MERSIGVGVGEVVLNRRGWVKRTFIMSAIAEGIASAMDVDMTN
jgi:hypothetical protein